MSNDSNSKNNNFNLMDIKSFLIRAGIIIFTLFLIFILGIAILINTITYSVVEKLVSKYTNLKIEFVSPKSTISPNLNTNIKAKEINLYSRDKKIKFITLKNPDITIKPFSLIFKKINLKKSNIEDVQISIKRDSKGEIDLLKELKIKDLIKIQDYKFTRLNADIKNINLTFKDEFNTKTSAVLSLKDTNINVSKRKNTVNIINKAGIVQSEIYDKKNTADIKFDINTPYTISDFNKSDLNVSVKGFDISLLNDLFKKYISKEIINTKGIVDFEIKPINDNLHNLNIVISKPSLNYKDKLIAPYNSGINIKSNFTLDKDIKIDTFTIEGDKLFLSTTGEIIKPFSKKPEINLNIETKDTQLNSLFYILPDNLISYRPKGIPTLKNSNFQGTANGKINLKLFPLDITGNLKVSNIFIPGYPKPSKQNDVTAVFMKDKVRINTRVFTPDNEYVIVDGISNLDDSLWGKYTVKSTQNIDLNFAKLYLVPIQQIIGFNIGPVPIMNITGYGNIDIKTQGTIFDAQIFGEFKAKNATAEIEGLKVKLKNGTCRLIFDNRNLIFKEIKGVANDGAFSLEGIGNTKGEVSLKAKINNSNMHNILDIFTNSAATKPYTFFTKDISAVSGKMDTEISLKGTIKDYENPNFLSELDLSGLLNFKNNKIILNNKLQVKNVSGEISFGSQQKGDLSLFINNSKLNILFNMNNSLKNIVSGNNFEISSEITSPKIEFKDVLNEIKKFSSVQNIPLQAENIDFLAKLDIKSKGVLNLKNLDLSKLKNNGYLIGLNSNVNKNISFDSGLIKFENNKIIFNNFVASILDGKLKIKGDISKFLSKNPYFNLDVYTENLNLKDVSLTKIKLSQAKIKNAHIEVKNSDIKFNPISIEYQGMPLFIQGSIKDIYKTSNIETHFSTIANEATNDGIINRFLTTPIKIKGEIPIKGYFKGKSENYTLDFMASIPEHSDILFSGANIGEEHLQREISGKIIVNKNVAELNNIKLIKYIVNQNGKVNPVTLVKTSGKIVQTNDDLQYDDFKIATNSPVNVRILNLIFKKSLLKKGNIECNVNLNGNIQSPKINGRAYLQDLDIPLYNTLVDNIKLYLTNDYINGEILAKNNENDLKVTLKAENKSKPPYIVEDVNIFSNKLDIIEVLNSISLSPAKTDVDIKQNFTFKPEDIVIKKGRFEFKDVSFEKINAKNLKGNFNYKNNLFALKDILFDMAEGNINASGDYNTKTTELKLKANMNDCNSNILTEEILRMKGQLFGKMNGSIDLRTKNFTGIEAIKNIKSEVAFSIDNGKMPKLGSLEYLLRASNLIKNGLFGLSLNNIIQILTPYKTGDFETISGNIVINKGEIEKLNITTKSKNLSMHLEGTYSILDAYADIKIYGKLSQNISNALGAVGNASFSQFINSITSKKSNIDDEKLKEKIDKIPSIEIENPEPKYFRVKVLGDINKDNYIKNFSWI